jgi:cyclohexadienyl dehydratase
MAHDLAARLGVAIAFVPSVWVDLLDDFLADGFDIAMGGVTVTAARAERAFFSIPTFVDGNGPWRAARTATASPRSPRSTSPACG